MAGQQGWLVELATPEGPRWARLVVSGVATCTIEWVPDSLRATHFGRHEDAVEASRAWMGSTITEHVWGDPPLPAPPPIGARDPAKFQVELHRLLGLPRYTRKFVLACEADAPPHIVCYYYPSNADVASVERGLHALELAVSEYELVPKPEISAVVADADGLHEVLPGSPMADALSAIARDYPDGIPQDPVPSEAGG